MKRLLMMAVMACLLLMPMAAAAQYEPKKDESPPVAQTLVREGDFAVKLVEKLKIGTVKGEAEAEDLLAKAGIAPKNGWISDYPVTPVIMSEVQGSVDKAVSDGKITLTKEEADKAFFAAADELGIPIKAADSYTGKDVQAHEAQPEEYYNPTVIENYYYDEGPPVVTYYSPPWDYYYLYNWVPYPFWWDAFWFPGFFILRDFTISVVVVDGRCFVVNDGTVVVDGRTVAVTDRTATRVVTNTVRDPKTRDFARVDPASGRFVRANETTRDRDRTRDAGFTGSNRKAAESIMRRGVDRASAGTRTTETNAPALRGRERDAGAIAGQSGRETRSERGVAATRTPSERGQRSFDRPAMSESRSFDRPSARAERSFDRPAMSESRSFDRPSARAERSFSAPSAPSRGFDGGGGRSFSAPSRGFDGGGGGRSFSAPSAPARGFDGGGGGRSFGGGGGGGRSFGGGGGGGCKGGRC